jgi:hypothetical protein
MYKPLFNQVLVEIDTESDKWGTGNDDSMLGKDYREGTLLKVGDFVTTDAFPLQGESLTHACNVVGALVGERVMWNEGHEAGKKFEHDGKLYAFVYWWDLVAVEDAAA